MNRSKGFQWRVIVCFVVSSLYKYDVAFSRCIGEELTDRATQDALHGKADAWK